MTMEASRRAFHVAGIALLVVLIVPFIIVAAPQVAGAEHGYVVVSGSMQPTIGPGDVVVVNDVSPSRIQQGDVIVFRSSGAGERANADRITHRVVDVVREDGQLYFRTKGDANEEPDQQLVPAEDVIGRVGFHIPYIGYVINFGSTDAGLVALVIVPSALLIANEVWTFVKAIESNRSTDSSSEADNPEGGGR